MADSESVGPKDGLLNSLALDGLEEQGDARAAWQAVSLCVENGLPFPGWVTRYLRRTATGLLDHLDNRDERNPIRLVNVLGFDRLIKSARYDPDRDPDAVFERITTWRATGDVKTISDGARRYHAEVLKGIGSPETVRVLFHEGKKRQLGD